MNRLPDKRFKGKRARKSYIRDASLVQKRWKPNTCTKNSEPLSNSSSVTSTSSEISASERKLKLFTPIQTEEAPRNSADFSLVHSSVWSEAYKGLKCSHCGAENVKADISEQFAFAGKVCVKCSSCNTVYNELYTSPRVTSDASSRPPFEVNRRMVSAFLSLGKGHAGLEQFCMSMGMTGISQPSYNCHLLKLSEENLLNKSKILDEIRVIVRGAHVDTMNVAAKDEIIDICVSYDGTWHKRGHTSNYGIGFVIDVLTGLVIDYELLSRYCNTCAQKKKTMDVEQKEYKTWQRKHQDEGACEQNFNGSANAMEVEAAKIMWQRSVDTCKMRYTSMLSDGDAKTFLALTQMAVYGDDIVIQKEECLNHVSKRLNKGLRTMVQDWKKKNVTLGGKKKGSLTEEMIPRLQNYYRKAILENIPNVADMKRAIYATLCHAISTDTHPQHSKCPGGQTSWCFYNRAIAKGEQIPKHDGKTMKTVLREDVVAKILPVYQRLASEELLQRCTMGRTQNANESLHSVIWKKCPKEVFVSKKRLEIAVASGVIEFNMGCIASISMIEEITEVKSSSATWEIAAKRDKRRLQQAASTTQSTHQSTRRSTQIAKTRAEEKKKQEGPTYEAGAF